MTVLVEMFGVLDGTVTVCRTSLQYLVQLTV